MRGTVEVNAEKKARGFLHPRAEVTNFFWYNLFFSLGRTGPFTERYLLGTCLRRQQEDLRGHV